jgi:hypothetical protein
MTEPRREPDDLEIQDTSGLTEVDWTEINKLRKAYKRGGSKALDAALEKLARDPLRYVVAPRADTKA